MSKIRAGKDFKKALKKELKKPVEIDCPKCKASIKAKPGHNVCPNCGADVNFNLKV